MSKKVKMSVFLKITFTLVTLALTVLLFYAMNPSLRMNVSSKIVVTLGTLTLAMFGVCTIIPSLRKLKVFEFLGGGPKSDSR